MIVANYYEGDRSEFLAAYALSCVGYYVPVPRQVDRFLLDHILYIFRPAGKVHHSTSLACGVQVKSNTEEIKITGTDDRESFYWSGIPFLICIVDKKSNRVRIYTTIHRLFSSWTKNERDLELTFGPCTWTQCNPGSSKDFPLGDPIVDVSVDRLDSDDKKVREEERQKLRSLADWVSIERLAIAFRFNSIPMIPLPDKIRTNEGIDPAQLTFVAVHGADARLGALSLLTSVESYKEFLAALVAMKKHGELTAEVKDILANAAQNLSALLDFIKNECAGDPNV